MQLIINDLLPVIQNAGEIILEIYNKPEISSQIEEKEDKSPLTLADKKSNAYICDHLEKKYPDIPIISEENKSIPYEKRKTFSKFWLLDPLDGTKEFIKRNGEFTVNLALIENKKPVLGIVYVPVSRLMYYGFRNGGAYVTHEGTSKKLEVLPFYPEQKGLKIVASRSHLNEETQAFINKFAQAEIVSKGSSLKLIMVAEGNAHVYPRLAPTMEWDTAAAQIIVEEAGGRVIHAESAKDLEYNKEILKNPPFVVFAGLEQGYTSKQLLFQS
jgi:3'(2'), 5'-bisphosphate nucleotidase